MEPAQRGSHGSLYHSGGKYRKDAIDPPDIASPCRIPAMLVAIARGGSPVLCSLRGGVAAAQQDRSRLPASGPSATERERRHGTNDIAS